MVRPKLNCYDSLQPADNCRFSDKIRSLVYFCA
jgi:hypothetical protein